MLELLSQLVDLDTPSGDLRLLITTADELKGWFAELGHVERAVTSAPAHTWSVTLE